MSPRKLDDIPHGCCFPAIGAIVAQHNATTMGGTRTSEQSSHKQEKVEVRIRADVPKWNGNHCNDNTFATAARNLAKTFLHLKTIENRARFA